MHASLAVALSYGQYLHGMSGKQLATEYYYHWFQSVKLFNKSLDGSLLEINKDSLWGTAAALAMLSFASATSQSQEDLSISHVVALEWLYMDEGKMSLWQLVNPLRPESIFSVMVETYAQMNYPFPTRGVGTMSKRLAAMCALDGNSTSMTNSYFFAAHAVWDILALHNTEITVGHTERFAHSICGRFRILFLAMDPIALVLLCLWLRKAGCSIWWIQCRADLECPLIYAYLDQHFKSHSAVLTALLDEYIGSPYSGKQ